MATPKKIQYKDYADYLKSPKWKQVKQDYRDNEEIDCCMCCMVEFDKDTKHNYHHFRYAKDWNNDTWENLIIICEPCHNLAHSVIEHNSNPITVRSYLRNLSYFYQSYINEEQHDIYCQEFASKLSRVNCQVTCNREGRPTYIDILEPIVLRDIHIAKILLRIQQKKSKVGK